MCLSTNVFSYTTALLEFANLTMAASLRTHTKWPGDIATVNGAHLVTGFRVGRAKVEQYLFCDKQVKSVRRDQVE